MVGGGPHEVREDPRLHPILVRRVLRVPLHAQVPPVVVAQGDGLDHTVRGVRRRHQALAQHLDALVVVAGDRRAGADDVAQR